MSRKPVEPVQVQPCEYLKSHISQVQGLELMKILEIDPRLYDDNTSVRAMCKIMERERPDMMRGRGWNFMRGMLANYHWTYLVGAAGAAAVGAATGLMPLTPLGYSTLLQRGAYIPYYMYLGHKLGILEANQMHGVARSAATRDIAREYLGYDPRYDRNHNYQRKYKIKHHINNMVPTSVESESSDT